MQKLLPVGFVIVVVSALGCGSDGSGTGGASSASASSASGTGGATATSAASTSASTGSAMIPDSAFTVEFPTVEVQPGVEKTQCVVKRLGNPESIHVGAIINKLTAGSHHLIVYRTSDTEEQPTPFDCDPFIDTLDPTKGAPLMITQKEEEVLSLPTGVAFTLDANQMVRLEMHYLNASGSKLDIGATSSFVPVDNFTDEADFLFIGNPDIDIAPMSKAVLGPTYFAMPAMFDNVNVFALTGHTHQWGTNVEISIAQTKDGPDTKVYDVKDWSWSEPETVFPNPPFPMPPGGGFRFTCEYDNKSDQAVQFGESAKAEMCFFWAYYYPSKGAFVCAHTDQVPGGFDLCCPGNPLCDQLF